MKRSRFLHSEKIMHLILFKSSYFQNTFIRIAQNQHKSVHCGKPLKSINMVKIWLAVEQEIFNS